MKISPTVIIDACRCFTWLNESEQLDTDKSIVNQLSKELNNIECRDYYNILIEETPVHVELIQSTQYGHIARASQTGSIFCDSLFKVIYDNASAWNIVAMGNEDKQNCKTTEELVEHTRSLMGPFGQIPQFRTNNVGNERFPFYAVKRESRLF